MPSAYVPESNVLDLVNATIPFRERLAFGSPQEYADHPILNRVLTKGMRATGGTTVEVRTAIKKSSRTQFTGLYAQKEYAHQDFLAVASAPWAHLTTDWMFDEREVAMNRDPERIVDIMEVCRQRTMLGMADEFEKACWQTVVTEANEFGSFRGVPYWIAKGASDGYTGKSTVDRSGTEITSVGGINANTSGNELWANYYHSYTNFIDNWVAGTITTGIVEDALTMLLAMEMAKTKTRFKAPRTVSDLEGKNPLANYKIYMDTDTTVCWSALLRKQNEGANFGYDIGKFNGQHAFEGIPIETVQFLDLPADGGFQDADITGLHPIYFVNHNALETVVLKGYEFKEHAPRIMPGNANVAVTDVDLSVQLMAKDRRCLALVATS